MVGGRAVGKTTLHATSPARLSRANPAPALTQLATPSPQREILLVQPLPKIVGLRSWENTCQGAGSLAVGAGEAGFKGLTGGHEVNQRHHPPISRHTPDSWPGKRADHPRDAYRKKFFFFFLARKSPFTPHSTVLIHRLDLP